MLLSAQQLTKVYGARSVLDGVSLYLDQGEKLGIIGVNGTGKTTLLRLLAGAEEPDSGSVTRDPNIRVEYLPQVPNLDGELTILEQVFAGLDPTARELAEYEAKTTLTQLGITDFTQKVGHLSGGQRKRVAMASALVHHCDVLILDEPTNHLDSEMVLWLEEYLRRFTGALVMVTHDRYFLERVVNRLVEVEAGQLSFYPGSYAKYLELKAQREEMAQASERKRQSILRREYLWVMQGPTARGTKSRERLERYEDLKNQEAPTAKAQLEFSALSSRLGRKTIELTGVSKAFDDRQILHDFSLLLLRDDRIGIVGRNGTGKSTLLNLLAGTLTPDTGEIEIGETVKIGYFCQENPSMDPNIRVIDYVKEIGNHIETTQGTLTATQLLEQFSFPKDAQWAPIGKLSGGEKRRLFLLSILATAPNILLLDEPTNDLDIQTLTVLEDYLETFPGAVIAVSHDRYFLDKTVVRLFDVQGNGMVTEFSGNYADYLAHRQALEKAKVPKVEKKPERTNTPKKLKFTFKEQRDFDSIDGEIAELEQKLQENQTEQAEKASDYMALESLQAQQTQLEAQLEEKMDRWVYLTDLAEQIANQ